MLYVILTLLVIPKETEKGCLILWVSSIPNTNHITAWNAIRGLLPGKNWMDIIATLKWSNVCNVMIIKQLPKTVPYAIHQLQDLLIMSEIMKRNMEQLIVRIRHIVECVMKTHLVLLVIPENREIILWPGLVGDMGSLPKPTL